MRRVFRGWNDLRRSEKSGDGLWLSAVVLRLRAQQRIKETERRAAKIAYLEEKIGRAGSDPRAVPVSRKPAGAEAALLFDAARKAGFGVASRGWPDFLCWGWDRGIAVSVVKGKRAVPSPAEALVIVLLELAGVECYLFAEGAGFYRPYTNETGDPFPV